MGYGPHDFGKITTPSFLIEDANYLFLKSHISINDNSRIMVAVPYHDHHLLVDPPDHDIFVSLSLGIKLTNMFFGYTYFLVGST